MGKFWFFCLWWLLVLIHTMDMEFTKHHIGNDWHNETFLPMQICIREFGINNSLWISRGLMYPMFLLFLLFRQRVWVCNILLVVTVLYWTSMLCWIETLGIATWPFPLNVPE
jgi:hypothetical protein